jgi:hypothetical protein
MYRDWKIGILQGADDVVMASIFGSRTPWDHEKVVYGPNGIYAMTEDPTDNCAAWVPRTPMHTFLPFDPSSKMKAGGISAMDFATEILTKGPGRNYR